MAAPRRPRAPAFLLLGFALAALRCCVITFTGGTLAHHIRAGIPVQAAKKAAAKAPAAKKASVAKKTTVVKKTAKKAPKAKKASVAKKNTATKKASAVKKAPAAKRAPAAKKANAALKTKKTSIVATGPRAKWSVFSGKKQKTSGGLEKSMLMKNQLGKIVSKAKSAASKRLYESPTSKFRMWSEAVQKARKELGITGMVPIGGKTQQGKQLYAKAKDLYTAS